jgi:hypothetical protein
MLCYFGAFGFLGGVIKVQDIDLLISEFLVVFIIVNIFAICYCEYYTKKWANFEALVPERLKIYRDFERLFIEKQQNQLSAGSLGEFEKKLNAIKYLVLRQEFLWPTFTPIIKESCLRDDFNFASYLSKALYKTVNQALEISTSSLLAFLLFVGFYIGLRLLVPSPDAAQASASGNADSSLEIYIMGGMSLIFFMQDTAIKLKTHSIFTKLIRSVKTPYEFTINPFDAIRNPNYEKISVPRYLKKTDAMYVSKRRVVNAHEALFWMGSPKLMIRFMHFS